MEHEEKLSEVLCEEEEKLLKDEGKFVGETQEVPLAEGGHEEVLPNDAEVTPLAKKLEEELVEVSMDLDAAFNAETHSDQPEAVGLKEALVEAQDISRDLEELDVTEDATEPEVDERQELLSQELNAKDIMLPTCSSLPDTLQTVSMQSMTEYEMEEDELRKSKTLESVVGVDGAGEERRPDMKPRARKKMAFFRRFFGKKPLNEQPQEKEPKIQSMPSLQVE